MSYNLFLDDERDPRYLQDTRKWEIVRSYDEFVEKITKDGMPKRISFDHDLADEHYKIGRVSAFTEFDYSKVKEKTGYHCVKWLIDYCLDHKLKLPEWQTHTMNPCGRENMEKLLKNFEEFQRKQNE